MPSITTIFLAKALLAIIGIGFVWLFYFFGKDKFLHKILIGIFIPFVLLASWGFFYFNRNIVQVGYWDLYHYYTNSKYFDELSYFDLYRASLVANGDNGGPFGNVETMRNLHTQAQEKAIIGVAEQEALWKKFSPARWEEFCQDVKFFFGKLSPRVLTDRGYNASPTWNKTGSLITNALPIENTATIPILLSFDILIFSAIVIIIWAVFGIVPALFFLFLFGVNPLAMTPLQFAFLRFDWLLALVASIAFWKKKHFAASGVALAISSFSRIFPVILLAGVALQAGFEFLEKKKISPNFRRFFIGFGIAAAALFLYGSLNQSNHFDFSRWGEFAQKIMVHSQASSNQRSGLSYLIPNEINLLRIPLMLFVLAFFAWVAQRQPTEKLIPLGLILVPLISAPASYYFCFVAVFILAFADLGKKRNALALSLVLLAFALQAFMTIHENVYHNSATSHYWSILYFILSLALLTIVASDKIKLKSHQG